MKKLLVLFLVFLSITSSIQAQGNVELKEVKQSMSKGDNNGLQATYKNVLIKDVDNTIRQFLAPYKPSFVYAESNKNELIADDVMIPSINDNAIDIHYQMVQNGTDVLLTMFYNLGGVWASSTATPAKYSTIYTLSNRLHGKLLALGMEPEVNAASEKVKAISSELKTLEQTSAKLSNEIESAKKTITTSEKAISENNSDITKLKNNEQTKLAEIEKEKAALSQLNLSGLQEQIKIMEKEKSTAQKTLDKNNKLIAKNQAAITKLQSTNEQIISQNKTQEATVKSKTDEIAKINTTIASNNLVEREKNLVKMQKEAEKLKSSQDKVASNTSKSSGTIEESKSTIAENEKAIADNAKAIEAKKVELAKAQEALNTLKDAQKKLMTTP